MSAASGYSLFVQDHCNNNGNAIDGCALTWGKLEQAERNRYNHVHAQNRPDTQVLLVAPGSSHERVGGHGEVSKSYFSYLSTNVAKTMTKNGWPESLTKSMTKYVKVASSSDRMKDYDSKVILKALAITHAELVEWIQIHKNRKLLANIIVSILDEYQNAREIAPTVLHLDTTYAVLQNPNTNWNNAKIIDRIRPIYLVHASLLAGGDYDLIWWFQH